MEESKKIYGVWLPIQLISDAQLSPTDKMVYAALLQLEQGNVKKKTNCAIAALAGCSSCSVRSSIANLNRRGYIYVTRESHNIRTIEIIDAWEDVRA